MALLALVLALLITTAQPAQAYIDPGSGSLLLQAAMATLAGAGFALRRYMRDGWRKVNQRLRSAGRGAPGS